MRICIRTITVILVLLAASNAFASLNGSWQLQVDVINPIACSFSDAALHITQIGTSISGTANLLPLGLCPITLTGTMNGFVVGDPTLGGPFSFFWTDPGGSGSFFTIDGQFTDPAHANGTFSGFYLGFIAASGNWALSKNVHVIPASTPWGRIILIVLAGLVALHYLRKRRTAAE